MVVGAGAVAGAVVEMIAAIILMGMAAAGLAAVARSVA